MIAGLLQPKKPALTKGIQGRALREQRGNKHVTNCRKQFEIN
jgi:hypothetical protein